MKELRVVEDFCSSSGKLIKQGSILQVVNEGMFIVNVRYNGDVVSLGLRQKNKYTVLVGGLYDR